MIRMGRGSRSDQSNETPYQDQAPDSGLAYQYTGESANTTRPVTDSESMARDIKEGRLSGFVGHGTTLTGETVFQAMLRVDGHLIGSITSEAGTLIVGTNGQVDANVNVSTATINGVVNGDVIASERIQLGRTAKVVGNIQTPRLTIEDGAMLEGGCTMLKARETAEKQSVTASSAYQAAETPSYSSSTSYQSVADEDDDDDDDVLASAEDDDDEDDDKSEAATV
ncbi:MAG TPA: polymer-forming cytoskeletal protein [Pyrinomonadaceae bacterium]|nr:polymer-forming cytoskeletal protein [Pyrinomonadaceae bacterium]